MYPGSLCPIQPKVVGALYLPEVATVFGEIGLHGETLVCGIHPGTLTLVCTGGAVTPGNDEDSDEERG